MSQLETQILRQMQTPALDAGAIAAPLQVQQKGSAPGPSHSPSRIAGTERLVDQRTLPWLELQIDGSDERDRAIVQRFPAMRDPFLFAAALRRAMPEMDQRGEGVSVSQLRKYVREHGTATPEAAAVGIALNHFDDFSIEQGVSNRLFHLRITRAEIANFEKEAKPFAVVAKHPEIRNPSIFLSTMKQAFPKIDTNGDGMLDGTELTDFINKPGGEGREQAAAALVLANSRTLSAIGDDGYFARPDLFVIGALTVPNFQEQLDAAVLVAKQDPSNVAEGVVVGSVTGYAVAKASGNQHPMQSAVVAGIAGALIDQYLNGEPERIADRLRGKRQLLEQTAIFNLEVSK